ncbi:MAG: hypothetical protein K1X29_10675 [Bdellovibrionales bacterium]|nr:hypothetical protein [Bdellovibrionales bacterium]
MDNPDIRPYVYKRKQFRIENPGQRFSGNKLTWFDKEPIVKNPQNMDEVDFTDQILRLENKVFDKINLSMPRWVFYDCAIMPGIIVGYAIKKKSASAKILQIVEPQPHSEWVPLSLFIIIPTLVPGEWVAHNLSSINSALSEPERFYGLGFISKAFGLWYANIEVCCGMTQWTSPAIKLHSHYGDMEILTAYTPAHTYAQTLTYRVKVSAESWPCFFAKDSPLHFHSKYRATALEVDRKDDKSLLRLQRLLERGEERYFLSAAEINSQPLDSKLKIYHPI